MTNRLSVKVKPNNKIMLSTVKRIPSRGFNANTFWIIAISAITVTLWSGLPIAVYGAPAKLDPIAVAVPNDSAEGLAGAAAPKLTSNSEDGIATAAATTRTVVDVESAKLVELSHGSAATSTLPSYLLELNDPNIGGPVDYIPSEGGASVIAWDLLPPINTEQEPHIITAENNTPKRVLGVEDPKTHNIRVSLSSGQSLSAAPLSAVASEGSVSIVDLNRPTGAAHRTGANDSNERTPSNTVNAGTRFGSQQHHRGSAYFSSTTTTPRSTTSRTTLPTTTAATTTTSTTTTTRRPITTTTTRRTTRPPPPTTAGTTRPYTATTTVAPLNSAEFYQLENGDSYTLPSWLADFEDPDLDTAVTFIVPDNINEYNDTISRDILPPLEPFTDLNNIDIPAPKEQPQQIASNAQRNGNVPTQSHATTRRPAVSTTTRTTTTTTTNKTRRPTTATSRPHWVRANPTTAATTSAKASQKPNIFNNRFSSNHFAQTHDSNFVSSSTFPGTTKTGTTPIPQHTTIASFITSTATTTPRPRTTQSHHHQQQHQFKVFNQNLPTTTIDPITSVEVDSAQITEKPKFVNPFLPTRNSGARPFSAKTATTTTSTTTTTTTPASLVDENPFDTATIPPWLIDFDYPDVGPGVPFAYDPATDDSNVANDLLPPSQLDAQATDSTKPVFVTSSPASFNNFQVSQSFTNPPNSFISSSSAPVHNSNFPSKSVTVSKPSTTTTTTIHRHPVAAQTYKNEEDAVTSPPFTFASPAESDADASSFATTGDSNIANNFNANKQQPAHAFQATKKPSSSNFNKNFAAPFEPTAIDSSGAAATPSIDQDVGSSTKTTFTKSNDGKVITNNIFPSTTSHSDNTTPTKPFGFGFGAQPTNQQKDSQAAQHSSSTNTNQYFSNGATGFTSAGSSFSSSSSGSFGSRVTTTTAGTGKYTGGFGGAPGVLGSGKLGYAVQPDGSIRDPDQAYRTSAGSHTQSAVATAATAATAAAPKPTATFGNFANRVGVAAGNTAAVGVHKYNFGGPPGVLVPFDNLKGAQA